VSKERGKRATAPASPLPPDPGRRERWLAAAVVIATLVAYVPSMQAGFIWDDAQYVTDNTTLRSLDGLRRMWIPRETPQYYPLVFTTFWIEHQLWGDRPLGYHVVNVLLHAASAVLVWRLARRLAIPGALLVAAVFALHPVHVESVAWVTERKNVLSGFLYLLAALAYLRFDDRRGEDGRLDRWYALALVLFLGALLSKTVTSSLPVALVIMMIAQGRRLTLRRLAPLAPFLVLGLVLGLHTAHLERTHVGAVGPDFELAFAERVAIAGRALLFYPWKVLVPSELTFIYPRWTIDAHALASFWPLPVIALAAGGLGVLWWRGRRGPALAAAFYAISIFPALGFFNVYPMIYSFVADHFQYLASLGVIALLVGTATTAMRGRPAAPLIACVYLAGLGTLTWYQGRIYQDYEQGRLWEANLRHNPESWLAHTTLGLMLCERGRFDDAEPHLLTALRINPDAALIHGNIAQLRLAQGDPEAALASYERAAEIDEFFALHVARTLLALGRDAEADPWLRRAVEAAPHQLAPRRWLAQRLLARGAVAESRALLAEALAVDPGYFPAHLMLGDAAAAEGRLDACAGHYRDALARADEDGERRLVLARLAGLYSSRPDATDAQRAEAVGYAEEANRLADAGDPDVLAVLAAAYAAVGRLEDARITAAEAARVAREQGRDGLADEIEAAAARFGR
jgi:tetratricopeptide (TPR) repeat protein